jgi:hypothetical protein
VAYFKVLSSHSCGGTLEITKNVRITVRLRRFRRAVQKHKGAHWCSGRNVFWSSGVQPHPYHVGIRLLGLNFGLLLRFFVSILRPSRLITGKYIEMCNDSNSYQFFNHDHLPISLDPT